MFKKSSILLGPFLVSLISFSQPISGEISRVRMTASDYIIEYADDAVLDMKKTGVPASITLAQGMFESDYGNSKLALEARNHFGIKCHKEWTGDTFYQDDDEKNECFRKYNSVLDSYLDHSDFLRTRDRYKFLFELEVTDYKAWAFGLKKAGYATNPEYGYRLIKIIEENNLQRFDNDGDKAVSELKSSNKAVNNSSEKVIKNIPTLSLCDDIPYYIAEKGDTWFKIAMENNLELSDLFKYNDVNANTILRTGMLVYLDIKHKRSSYDFYIVKNGDTMWYISQLYGIKLKKLNRLNKMKSNREPVPGQKIKLH